MFEWVPILQGKYFTYQEYLFLLSFFGFMAIGLSFILIGKIFNRKRKTNLYLLNLRAKESIASDDYHDAKTDVSSISSEGYGSLYTTETEELCPKNLSYKKGTKAGNVCIWIGLYFFSLLPGVMGAFNILLPMWLAALMDFAIILVILRFKLNTDKIGLYHFLKENHKAETYEAQFKPLMSFYKKLLILFTTTSFILPVIFNRICVSAYQQQVGPIFGTASISTEFTRFFQLSKGCPPGPPCHMYATLPEDASTSVFINVQTDESYQTINIYYDTDDYYVVENSLRNSKESFSTDIEGTDWNGRRRVHSFYLDNLQPDTRYFFQIYYDGAVQAQSYYQTLPDETNKRDLVIVQGGDMGNTGPSRQITLATGQVNPDLIILGGDIAYDNGMCSCYFAWDFLLKDLDDINAQNGRLIPLILAVGNHDIGLDSINGKSLKTTKEGPFYMVFFPQHSRSIGQDGLLSEVPPLEERKSYHYHKVGNILIFNLDSGYLEDIGNEQALWMRNILDKYPSSIKFANYHCPIYFACKGNDAKLLDVVQTQKQEWGPIFDEYKFALAFENHEHHLKRTFPLKNDAINSEGTIYIGNGKWGTDDYDNCQSYNQTTGLYENVQDSHHFWIVNVSYSQGIIQNTAYDKSYNPIVATMSQEISTLALD